MRLLIHDCCPTSDLWSRNLGIGRIDGCLGEPRCRSVSVASNEVFVKTWRRERDSNPRYGFPYSGFQDHPFQPLTHPSAAVYLQFSKHLAVGVPVSGMTQQINTIFTGVLRGTSCQTYAPPPRAVFKSMPSCSHFLYRWLRSSPNALAVLVMWWPWRF